MAIEIPKITLNDGINLPVIGLGTYNFRGHSGVKFITSALENGYRLIDSAYNYENEETVGAALKSFPGTRFIAQKLKEHGRESFGYAFLAFYNSLH